MEEKIIELIADKLCKKKEQVVLTARLVEDLGADSLDIVEIVMDIEKMLDIEIPDDEWAEVNTVGNATQLIWRKLTDKYK